MSQNHRSLIHWKKISLLSLSGLSADFSHTPVCTQLTHPNESALRTLKPGSPHHAFILALESLCFVLYIAVSCFLLDTGLLEVQIIFVWLKHLVQALELNRCSINYCCDLWLRATHNNNCCSALQEENNCHLWDQKGRF